MDALCKVGKYNAQVPWCGTVIVSSTCSVAERCVWYVLKYVCTKRSPLSLFLVLLPLPPSSLPRPSRPPNKVGINFDMRWDLALPLPKDPFCVRPEFSDEITVVRIFPGPFSTLKTLLQPPLRGLVMQTFGAGNAPDADPVFLGLLKEACDRGVVIINITQCAQGMSTRLV